MGQIEVEGLGTVDIAGDRPTAEEQAAIVKTLQAVRGGRAPAATSRRADQDLAGAAAQSVYGFNEGLRDVLGSRLGAGVTGATTGLTLGAPAGPPGMLAGMLAGGLGGFLAGPFIGEALGTPEMLGPEPASDLEKAARAGGRVAGIAASSFAVPAAATRIPIRPGLSPSTTATGASIPTGGLAGARAQAEMAAETLTRGVAAAPAMATAGELAGGYGSGVAEEIARQEGAGPLGRTMAGMAGAVVAPTAMGAAGAVAKRTPMGFLARKLGPKAKDLLERYRPDWTTTKAKRSKVAAARRAAETRANLEELQSVIGEDVLGSTEGRAASRRATDIARRVGETAYAGLAPEQVAEMPQFRPTIGEMTGRQSMIASQRDLESRASGDVLDWMQRRRQASGMALEAFRGQVGPEGGLELEEGLATAASRVARLGRSVERATEQAAAQRAEVGDLPRIMDPAGFGRKMRESIWNRRSEVRDALNQEYGDLGDVNADLGFRTLARNVLRWVRGQPKVNRQYLPSDSLRILKALSKKSKKAKAGKGKPVTFQDLKDLREMLVIEGLEAGADTSAGHLRRQRAIKAMRGMVDDTIENGDFIPPELADRYRQFLYDYRTQLKEPFDQGPAWQVRRQTAQGAWLTDDEKVARQFLSQRGAQQYRAMFGDNPDTIADYTSVVVDDLADFAVRDGVIDPKRLRTWMMKNRGLLREMPEVRGVVGNIKRRNTALATRQQTLANRQKAIDGTVIAQRLRSLARGTQTPEGLIDDALRKPVLMRRIMHGMNEEGRRGFARLLGARIMDMPDGLDWIASHAPALREVMSDEHLADVMIYLEGWQMLNRVPPPGGSPIRTDLFAKFEQTFGIPIQSLASRYVNMKALRLSPEFVGIELLNRFFRAQSQRARDELFMRALYDPNAAHDLASMALYPEVKPDKMARKVRGWLFEMGQLQDGQDAGQERRQAAPEAPSVAVPQSAMEGPTATNPTTGERVIFRNGLWEPVNG